MGIFSKFKLFGKKDDLGDLKLDSSFEKGFKQPDFGASDTSFDQNRFSQPQAFGAFESQKSYNNEQEIKLISSKLDTLMAKMDNMNQRIANLERIASDSQR